MRSIGWMVLLCACGGGGVPVSNTEFETACDEVAATGACEAYEYCCTEAVHFQDGEEVDRDVDSCWFEYDTELYDCVGPDCSQAESDVQAAACAR